MIEIVAKHYVRQDKIEDFIALARKLVARTQKEDAAVYVTACFRI